MVRLRWYGFDNKQIKGRIAQLGERLPYKQDVIGSSPVVPMLENGSWRLETGEILRPVPSL